MAVTLWVSTEKDEALELGQTLGTYAAFAEIAGAVGAGWEDDYPSLSGVLTQCELGDDAELEWLSSVATEAGTVLAEHGADLGEDARNLLENLKTLGEPHEQPPGRPEDQQ